MVPVELGRDALGRVVGVLERVGLLELRDRVLGPAHAAQVVCPHVVRVRHGRSQPGVDLAVGERVVDAPDLLVRVDEVVVSGQMVRADGEPALVEGDRSGASALAAAGGGGLLGVAAQQPELDVVQVPPQRLVERLLVGGVLRHAREIGERFELDAARGYAALLPRRRAGGERFGLLELEACGLRVLEPGRDARQAEVGERQPRVDAQRLPERPRRFDPDVRVKVRDTLVVEGLGLGRRGGHRVVHLPAAAPGAGALAEPHGLLEQALRDVAHRRARGMRVVRGLSEGGRRSQQAHARKDACRQGGPHERRR